MSPDSVGGKTVAEQLQRALRRLALATVLLYVGLIGGGIKVYLDAKNTNDALCTFRQDLVVRVIGSTDFLKKNPEGIPGIPPKIILEGISNQQKTITALKDLNCPSMEEKP